VVTGVAYSVHAFRGQRPASLVPKRPTALRRICMTSSSIERPLPAARTRRRVRCATIGARI